MPISMKTDTTDEAQRKIRKLLKCYATLEQDFPIVSSSRYADLVTASTTHEHPVQRWFHLKEAYSLNLLETLIADWKIKPQSIHRILDPFCGTGTSLLAVQKLAKKLGRQDLEAVGIERNPFLHFVAHTKLQWHEFDVRLFEQQAAHLLNGAFKPVPRKFPTLSTLHRKDVYTKAKLREILGFKGAIDSVEQDERALLMVGYASVLEELSGTRKDGRTVRIVENKRCPSTAAALKAVWASIAEDAKQAREHFQPIPTHVLLGDGRSLMVQDSNVELGNFDLVIYSPPYLNNIDYTEVYKIELWLCGFVNTKDNFRALRYQTLRSHPSVRFPDPITFADDELMKSVKATLKILTNAVPNDEDRAWRCALFNGYFDDMYQSLKQQKEALRDGGWIFCIVGNSLHGSNNEPEARVPVASDLIIASIAQAVGLEVKGIQVARYLKRRGPDGHLLRESIVVMRKPSRKGRKNGSK